MSLHTLMFGWEYPPLHSGGLGVACQGLVQGLLRTGTRVTLVLPHNNATEEENLSILAPTEKVFLTVKVQSDLQPYDSFGSYADRLQTMHIPNGRDELYGPNLGDAVESFTAMGVDMTKDVQADVIHCHDWMTYDAGIRAAKYHGKPLVAHIHATEFDRTDFHPNEWIAAKERNGLMKADKIIAVSRYTQDMLVKHYGIPADKIAVVHNGYDHAKTPAPVMMPHKKHPLILFLGRLTIQKNPWQFLEVARLVHERRPDAQFVTAGDGPMLPGLIDRACELNLDDCEMFTGKVNGKEVRALYAAADCFVMPSLSEPFGLVALEAIAHHTPVILSKQSGAAEVCDHAFKVDYWDTEKMTDCILTILREEPLAMQLKAEAPRILQKLTRGEQAKQVQSIYSNLIQS